MNKFSEIQAYDAVHNFVVVNGLLLSELLVRRVAAVAAIAWNLPEPVSVKTQHEFVYDSDLRAGRYRESILVNRLAQMRDYPSASLVSQLMVRIFTPAYERVFVGAVTHQTATPADVAWQIGAILRSIHPFEEGNRVLSWVIENQLRIRFGLPLVVQQRSKPEFDHFRHNVFFPKVEKMFRS